MKRYNKYYAYWKYLNIFIAFLAMTGLIIELRSWEVNFSQRLQPNYFTTTVTTHTPTIREIFVYFTTALAILCIFFKHYSAEVWSDYPCPVKFYKQIVLEEHRLATKLSVANKSFKMRNLT